MLGLMAATYAGRTVYLNMAYKKVLSFCGTHNVGGVPSTEALPPKTEGLPCVGLHGQH